MDRPSTLKHRFTPSKINTWVLPKIGVKPPKWMVKIMENPIKMDDLGVPPLFLETPTPPSLNIDPETWWLEGSERFLLKFRNFSFTVNSLLLNSGGVKKMFQHID